MRLHFFLEGIMLGLALFPSCLFACGPVYIPFMLIAEGNGIKKGFTLVLKLLGSRFLAYIIFGFLAGLLGGEVPERIRATIAYSSLVVLSILLFYNSIRPSSLFGCPTHIFGKAIRSPYLLGLATGFNICPAFLIAFTEAARSGGATSGALLFFGLAIISTLLFLPFGFLKVIRNKSIFPRIGQIVGVIAGLYFFAIGSSGLIVTLGQEKLGKYFVISPTEVDTIFVYTRESLTDSSFYNLVKSNFNRPVSVLAAKEKIANRSHIVIFVPPGLEKEQQTELAKGGNLVIIFPRGDKEVSKAVAFLKEYAFKVDSTNGAIWDASR